VEDAEYPVAAELGLDSVRPELREELTSTLTVGALNVRGGDEVVRVSPRLRRGRLLVRLRVELPLPLPLALAADVAAAVRLAAVLREPGQRLGLTAADAGLHRRLGRGDVLRRGRVAGAVPPGVELRLDQLAGDALELPVDQLADEELELASTLLDSGGDDLRELHGSKGTTGRCQSVGFGA
jgi:hypothetical protein